MSLTNNNIDFSKLVISEIAQVRAFSRVDGSFLFEFDQIKEGSLEASSETVYAEGKNNVRLAAFDRNKGIKFTCSNGYIVDSALAFQMGGEITTLGSEDNKTIRDTQIITATTSSGSTLDTITLSDTPVQDSVKYIYKLNGDGTPGASFSVASVASDTEFAITTGGVITLPTGTTAGTKFVVPYDKVVPVGKEIVNSGASYAGSVRLVIDLLCTHPCDGSTFLAQATLPNAKVDGNFTLSIGGDPSVQEFAAEGMLDPCSEDKELCRIVLA